MITDPPASDCEPDAGDRPRMPVTQPEDAQR
jgi:hypothetical protein